MKLLTELTKNNTDFSEITKIDKYALDYEWENQPSLYQYWADKAATAEIDERRAREERDLVRGSIDIEIRSNPKKFGMDKISETAISNRILLEKEFQEAQTNYINKKEQTTKLTALVWALEQRKKALEQLTQLFLASYFSRPNIKQEAKEWSDERVAENHREQLNINLKRRINSADQN